MSIDYTCWSNRELIAKLQDYDNKIILSQRNINEIMNLVDYTLENEEKHFEESEESDKPWHIYTTALAVLKILETKVKKNENN